MSSSTGSSARAVTAQEFALMMPKSQRAFANLSVRVGHLTSPQFTITEFSSSICCDRALQRELIFVNVHYGFITFVQIICIQNRHHWNQRRHCRHLQPRRWPSRRVLHRRVFTCLLLSAPVQSSSLSSWDFFLFSLLFVVWDLPNDQPDSLHSNVGVITASSSYRSGLSPKRPVKVVL